MATSNSKDAAIAAGVAAANALALQHSDVSERAKGIVEAAKNAKGKTSYDVFGKKNGPVAFDKQGGYPQTHAQMHPHMPPGGMQQGQWHPPGYGYGHGHGPPPPGHPGQGPHGHGPPGHPGGPPGQPVAGVHNGHGVPLGGKPVGGDVHIYEDTVQRDPVTGEVLYHKDGPEKGKPVIAPGGEKGKNWTFPSHH